MPRKLGPRSWRGQLLASLATAFVILLVGVVSYFSVAEVKEVTDQLERTHWISNTVSDIQGRLTAAELNHRGYLLTGDRRYLDVYHRNQTVAERKLMSLRSEAVSPKHISGLDSAIKELSQTHEQERTARFGHGLSALEMEHMEAGQKKRQAVTRIIAQVRAAADQKMAGWQSRLRRHQVYARIALLGGTMGAFLFAVGSTLTLRRTIKAHDEAEQRIAQRNVDLRATNEELRQAKHGADRARLAAERAVRDREQAIGELERANRELDQFVYVTSHDLKAPLRGISNLSTWIEEDLDGKAGPDTGEQLQLLRGRVNRMDSLIDGLLQYSRAGRSVLRAEVIDTDELVREVIAELAPDSSIDIEVGPGLPMIEASRPQLKQVLVHLIDNAFTHAENRPPEVRIQGRDAGKSWEFSIIDNGPGIDPRYHDRIFGIFQTLERRDKLDRPGVGLAIVKKLVDSAGGEIRVDSEPQRGARFIVIWPKTPSPLGEFNERTDHEHLAG